MRRFKPDDPEQFWLSSDVDEVPVRAAFERHCCNTAAHPALREIAGLAAARSYSQGYVAKKYSEKTGKSITAANVFNAFGSRRPHDRSLATYGEVIGMEKRHLSLVQRWPSLKWPGDGFGRFEWLNYQLSLDHMSPLFKSGEVLREFRAWGNDEQNREEAVELVNVVQLETERVLARDHRGRDRTDPLDQLGVSLEVHVKYQSLSRHIGDQFDFQADSVKRSQAEEMEESVLLRLFHSISHLTSSRFDYSELPGLREDERGRNRRESYLQPADVLAIVAVAEQLLAARGFRVGPMERRLRNDNDYGIWTSNHYAELED